MRPERLTIEHWPIARLIPYARNPRRNDHVVDRMAAAIAEFGFRLPVLARSDGTLVDGHLRLKAAQRLGLTSVPVALADDLSEAQIKAFRLLVNRSANWASWDDELVGLELLDLRALDYDLGLTGFDDVELQQLLDLVADEGPCAGPDEDAVPEPPAAPVTRPGDLWILGPHRLLCGDATVLADVERVLDGDRAAMCFTDAPYNVDYRGGPEQSRHRAILNDDLGGRFGAFLSRACSNILAVTDGAVYLCMSSSELHTLFRAFSDAGGHWSTYVIWAKNTFTLGRSDYQRQYEPILYGWKQGREHFWCGARDQGDVWFIDKPTRNDLHPTMKPVALVERAIMNSCRCGDLVLDPFTGSGTTAIACEKTSRRARMIELDPVYVDTIVERWQDFTGRTAVLEKDGSPFPVRGVSQAA